MRSAQVAPVVPPPARYEMPPATATPTVDAISAASEIRALADTRVIFAGSTRGVTELRVTPYAFCSTSTPNAAGSRVTVSLCWTAPAIPQQSRPRASRVPIMMYRRPSRTRSSIGPMNGASTANGAIVMSRVSAIRPRAWSTEVLKNSVPASATATNASAAAPAAVSSMTRSRPVRPAPEACVIRRMTRPVPRAVDAPARPVERSPDAKPPAARLACGRAPDSPMFPVFCVLRGVKPPPGRTSPGRSVL